MLAHDHDLPVMSPPQANPTKQSRAYDRPVLCPLSYMPNKTNTRGQSHLLSFLPSPKKKQKECHGEDELPLPPQQQKHAYHTSVSVDKNKTALRASNFLLSKLFPSSKPNEFFPRYHHLRMNSTTAVYVVRARIICPREKKTETQKQK